MTVQRVADAALPGLVVDPTSVGSALLVGYGDPQLGAQLTGAQSGAVVETEEVLAVDIIQLCQIVASRQAGVELVIQSGPIKLVGRERTAKTAVFVVQGQVLGIGRVAINRLGQTAEIDAEVVELVDGRHATAKGLRQNAAGVGLQNRQLGHQRTQEQL